MKLKNRSEIVEVARSVLARAVEIRKFPIAVQDHLDTQHRRYVVNEQANASVFLAETMLELLKEPPHAAR